MHNETIKKMLEDVKLIIATNRGECFRQGKEFNIFWVQRTADKEVKICRLIRELIDPSGSHGQGDIFLRRFISDVLKIEKLEFTSEDYQRANVVCEELIKDDRRIDLVIRIANKLFPIEVKVYAKDQDRQCKDYYNYAKNLDENSIIYYLTLDGHKPSKESRDDLSENQYKSISFGKEILSWLDECIAMEEIEQIYSVREILIQFRDVIRRLTGMHREKYEMDIKKIIFDSQVNMEAAMQIAKVLPDVKADMMIKVFADIEEYITNKNINLINKIDKNSYIQESKKYYQGNNMRPKIDYMINVNDKKFKGNLVLGFEIDHRLYFGIRTINEILGEDILASAEEYVKEKLTPRNCLNNDKDWFWWEYLNKENNVNYKNCDSGYEKLFDEKGFQEYMEPIHATIDKIMDYIERSKIDAGQEALN